MQFRNIIHEPVIRRMTTGTVHPDRLLVNVGVTGNTFRTGFCKYQCFVTIPAIHHHMLTFQRELRSRIVIEAECVAPDFPTRCG